MKILMINTVCGITSTGRICADIADLLEKQGHQCKIAYGRGVVPEKCKKYAVKIGGRFNTPLHALGSRIFDNTGFYSKGATKKFIKWAKEYNPDVIHLHNVHGYYINIKLLFEFLKEFKKPVVWTLHDCWAFTGHCSYYDSCQCEKWKTQCSKCPKKKEYPASILSDRSKKNYKLKNELFNGVESLTIVTPSKWLKEQVEQSFIKDCNVKVINNGIDLSMFNPSESDFRKNNGLEGKKIILGVANIWTERKGMNDFIEVSKRLDNNYKIVLVGNLYGQTVPEDIIHIKSTNDQKELAQIYTAADVFVNPTYEDNFPTTNIESLACGTPVITYNTGGSPESLNEFCGRVVERGDVDGLALAIKEFSATPDACIENAKKFDKKARFLEYTELYKELLQ